MRNATYRKIDESHLIDDAYGIEGKYLVSIQTKNAPLLTSYNKPTQSGQIAEKLWKEISLHFNNVEAGIHVLTKDTFYGILDIDLSGKKIGKKEYYFSVASKFEVAFGMLVAPKNPFLIEGAISHVISWFKASSLIEIIKSYEPTFRWASGYFDFSIQKGISEKELVQMIEHTIE